MQHHKQEQLGTGELAARLWMGGGIKTNLLLSDEKSITRSRAGKSGIVAAWAEICLP